MASRSRFAALPLLAVAALGLSACERGKNDHAASTSSGSPSSAASSPSTTTPEPTHLITPETLDKAPMILKYGESASIRRGGVTVTVTPGAVEKFDGTPKGGEKAFNNCGLWLALPVHVVIDAQPNAEWTGWDNIGFPHGLFSKDKKDLGSAGGGSTDELDDISNNTAWTWHDWSVTGHKVLHWDFTGKNYLAACKRSYETSVRVPDDRPVIGFSWDTTMNRAEENAPSHRPPLALWFP